MMPNQYPDAVYDPAYADSIVVHLAKGQSIRSFAGKLGRSPQTIYRWMERYPEFGLACEIGKAKREEYLINMGLMMATGQLRRLVREEPVLDARGNVVHEADGKVAMSRVYAHVKGEPAVWIFCMRNMCKWTNRDAVDHAIATTQKVQDAEKLLSEEELNQKVDDLHKRRALAKKTKPVKVPVKKKKGRK